MIGCCIGGLSLRGCCSSFPGAAKPGLMAFWLLIRTFFDAKMLQDKI